MGAELSIESLYDRAWERHGDDYRQAVADRDNFRSESSGRLGPDLASAVQLHVDAALGRLLADDLPALDPAAERAYHQLRALERAVMEIEGQIEVGNTFFDPYIGGLFPMSWWERVLPLLPENPGYMPVKNVVEFLEMVKNADQRLPSGEDNEEMADDFRKRRQELIEFLERAVELGEAVWCDL
jgi:hypothetical protein